MHQLISGWVIQAFPSNALSFQFISSLIGYTNQDGTSSPISSSASRIHCFTSEIERCDVIWLVPVRINLPSESTILRYPHQLWASPAPHFRIGWLSLEFPRSQVLNAQGTNNSSAALFTTGSAKILPASLQPCHPDHSTKFANIGFSVSLATSMAVL